MLVKTLDRPILDRTICRPTNFRNTYFRLDTFQSMGISRENTWEIAKIKLFCLRNTMQTSNSQTIKGTIFKNNYLMKKE